MTLPNPSGVMQTGTTLLLPGPERKCCGISQFILELGMIGIVTLLDNKAVPVQKTNLWKALPCTLPSSLLAFIEIAFDFLIQI